MPYMKTRSPTKTPARKKTHFVPRVVYRTAFVGVVPVCVAGTACGSGGSSGADAATVACSGFCGVAQQAFTEAGDAPVVPADAATDASGANADADSSCFCCPPTFCGVGIAAFADAGDGG
jgi:hypothetical protein